MSTVDDVADERIGRRDQLRLFARIFGICIRYRPAATALIVAILAAQAVSAAVLAIVQGTLVDQAPGGLGVRVVLAVLVGAVFVVLTFLGWRVLFSLQDEAAEAAEVVLADELLSWTTASATIEHLEDPRYLDRLEIVLRKNQALAYAIWALLSAVAAVVALVVSLVVLAGIHPALITLALFGLPPILLAGRAGDLYMNAVDRNAELLRLETHLHGLVTAADPLKELLVSRSGRAVDAAAMRIWGEMVDQELRARRMAVVLTGLGWLVYAVGVVLAAGWAVLLAAQGRISLGQVAVVLTLSLTLSDQIMNVLSFRLDIAEAGRVSSHFLWLGRRNRALPAPAAPVAAIRQGLVLEDVSFSYPSASEPAVSGITATIPAGSVVGIVGANGAGKSTLAKLLCGLYRPTSGRFLLDGEEADPGQLSQVAAGAFQDFTEFELKAYETVGIGDLPRVDDRTAVVSAADRGRGSSVVDSLPEGWESQLGLVFDGARLSKGQWQRLALSRGLMRDRPVLLVLDEPTAALDPQAEHDLFAAFAVHARRIAEQNGAITVLISHRFSTVTMTDQILVVEDGRLVEQGTHADLLAGATRYRELYESQAQGYRTET